MRRSIYCLVLLSSVLVAGAGSVRVFAQDTVTVRVLDAKTGIPIAFSNLLVRINGQREVHADWASQNEDRTAVLTLPKEASTFSFHATYDRAMEIYANCDSAGNKPIQIDRWYKISEILASGIVAPNACSKLKEIAKPGELVLFVRKPTRRDRAQEDAP
jgi:hypothetical protein